VAYDVDQHIELDSEFLSLTDLVEIESLQLIQDSFAEATNVASLITDVNGEPITKPSNFCRVCQIMRATDRGSRQCVHSDRMLGERSFRQLEPVIDTCSNCGLVDAAAPIVIEERHLGTWLIGQVNVGDIDKDRILSCAQEIGADPNEILTAYKDMECRSLESFQQVLGLLKVLTRQISDIGFTNLRLGREMSDRKRAEDRKFARFHRIQKQHRAMIQMMSHQVLIRGELQSAARMIDELVADTLDVDRVSIWLLDDDGTKLRCIDLYERGQKKHSRGMTLDTNFFPAYLDALQNDRVVAANDATTDPRTREFSEGYLKPLGIMSMLEGGIRFAGQLIGVICNEHIGDVRMWTQDEVAFIGDVSNQVAQTLQNREREKAERLARESDERFRVVSSQTGQVIYDLDVSTDKIEWVGAIQEVTGYTPEEFQEIDLTGWENLVHPEDQGMATRMRNRASEPEGRYRTEYRMQRRDGSYVEVEEQGALIFDDSRRLVRVLGTIKDVSERKQAERKQQRLQESLEKAKRMESLGLLAGGVAHDLNNMLGPLVGYPDLLLMKLPEDSPMRKQIERIGISAKHAADVIQDLLTLARRGRYDMEPTSLNQVIESYLDSVTFTKLKEDHPEVEVQLDLDPKLPTIAGSTPHLTKIIMNLTVNAFDAMHNGGKLRIVTQHQHLDRLPSGYAGVVAGEYVTLRVVDSGIGIASENIEKLFEPYYSNKKMGRSGTGLGLAVVYGILKDHKGYYDVFSREGQGTEFVLFFPAQKEEIRQRETNQEDYSGTETILVVDDEASQREIAGDLLGSFGYNVQTVSSGREAITFLKENKVDIVILDMIMEADFDGLDTYRAIVKIHSGQKAIIASGFSATDRVEELQKLGTGAYIKKPYTRMTIAAAVRKELDRDVTEEIPEKDKQS